MCPSYRITHDPAHSTEARVAAFKAALNGEYGEKPFGDERLAAAMDLCVSCKACKKECPSAVDMVLIKTEFLAQRNEAHGASLRTRLFAGLPVLARPLARSGANVDPGAQRAAACGLGGEKLLGLSARRQLPVPATRPFSGGGPFGDENGKRVWLFVDTFAHHFDPEVAEAAVAVLAAGGFRVIWRGQWRTTRSPAAPCVADAPICRWGWWTRRALKPAACSPR